MARKKLIPIQKSICISQRSHSTLPEVDLQQSKKQIKRATQLADAQTNGNPKEDFVQDALSQLQQEAERQNLEKIAKELEEKNGKNSKRS